MNIIRLFTLTAISALSLSAARAADWTLHYDAPSSGASAQNIGVQWETAVGSETSDGYWFTGSEYASENAMKGWLPEYENDNFTFGITEGREITVDGEPKTVYDSLYLYLNSDITLGSITFLGNGWNNSARFMAQNHNITVNADLIRDASSNNAFIYDVNVLTVKNNMDVQGSNFAVTGNKMIVNGNVVSTTRGANLYLTINGLDESGSGSGPNTLENPGVVIHGYASNISIQAKPTNSDNYTQIGGLTNKASIKREAPPSGGSNDYVSYFVLTNAQDYSTDAAASETNTSVWTPTSGKLAIIMNGAASQSFTSNQMQFQGGLQIMNGTLRINFNQNGNYYNYKRDAAQLIDVTFVTQNGGSTRTTFSHGNLQMLGGTFASTEDSSSYGAFRLTNIIYTSGTVSLRLESATQMDSLDLTSYYNRVADTTSGAEVVNYELVEGGAISFAEGAGKFSFNFEGDLGWLIDSEDGTFDVNGGLGAKIVAWDSGKGTGLSGDNFAANIFESAGDAYRAEFTIGDDGLYVKYVAVPEPAEVAAILGALALTAAALRRRGRK